VLVVDDGSTDGTAESARTADVELRIRVLTQENAGRFAARAHGIAEATGELVLFLDGRVLLLPGALEFVERRLDADSDDAVWNAHVIIDAEGNRYGRFWNVLTELAFSAYFSDPRTTSFDSETFDAFPKGTTCFLAPRELVLEGFGTHESYYADSRNANDDTPMIRRIAEQHSIGISPEFACLYRPRDAMRPFIRHAYHRGIVFLDGHGRRGSRFLPAVVLFYPVSVVLAVVSVRRPVVALGAFATVAAGAALIAKLKRRPAADAAAFATLAPFYAVAHGLGMWRGLALALQAKIGTSRQ
jgi:glycosyltransferase involved in cell wall biosynthesis